MIIEKRQQYFKKWYQEHKIEEIKRSKNWNKEHLEHYKKYQTIYQKEWYQKNKKRIRQQHKEYYQKNREKIIQQSKKWREGNREKILQHKKKYREKNRKKIQEYNKKNRKRWPSTKKYQKSPKCRYYKYKQGAKNRNIDFNLTFEQFMTFWQKPCYYCNNKIETIGLDRIDNNKGYSIDNIIPCCWECNRLKRAMNKNDFINQCIKIANHYEMV